MLNKKALIVATSLSAIPLTAALIAIVARRAKHVSLQRSPSLGQTMSESSDITTAIATTQSQQHKEEESQSQSESDHHQRSETAEATTTSATALPPLFLAT